HAEVVEVEARIIPQRTGHLEPLFPRHVELDPTVAAGDRLVLGQDGLDPIDNTLHQGGEGSLLFDLPVGPSRFDVFLIGTFISHWRLGTPLLHRAAAAVTQCSGGLSWPAVYSS